MEPAALLSPHGDAVALSTLIDALRAGDVCCCRQVVDALPPAGTWADGAPECLRLRAAFESASRVGDAAIRLLVLKGIERMAFGNGACDPIVIAGLSDPAAAVRAQAVRVIGLTLLSLDERRELLTHALHDTDGNVRLQAVRVIGRHGTTMAGMAGLLRSLLHDADMELSLAAAEAIVGLSERERPWVGSVLRIMDVRRRDPGFFGMYSTDGVDLSALLDASPDVVAAWFGTAMDHPDDDVRHAAMIGLSECGAMPADESVVLKIEAALLDQGTAGRTAAARALCGIGPQAAPAAATLARRLEDSDPAVREWSAKALGAIGPAAGAFGQALAHARDHDDDSRVRLAAAASLAKCSAVAEHA